VSKGRDSGMPMIEQWESYFVSGGRPQSFIGTTMCAPREVRRSIFGRGRSNVEHGARKRDCTGFATKPCPDHAGIGVRCLKIRIRRKTAALPTPHTERS
jgi:hypothetical protein